MSFLERRGRAVVAVMALASLLAVSACQYDMTTTAPTTTATTAAAGTTSAASAASTLTYSADVQPILASDCLTCHGPSRSTSGVDLSSDTAVMRTVMPGSANSLLVVVTRPGGLM
jgi:cytochrome c5